MALMTLNRHPVDYRYFDDYNEILERLKLLLTSESTENNAHNIEIVSLIEELREAHIIKLQFEKCVHHYRINCLTMPVNKI